MYRECLGGIGTGRPGRMGSRSRCSLKMLVVSSITGVGYLVRRGRIARGDGPVPEPVEGVECPDEELEDGGGRADDEEEIEMFENVDEEIEKVDHVTNGKNNSEDTFLKYEVRRESKGDQPPTTIEGRL